MDVRLACLVAKIARVRMGMRERHQSSVSNRIEYERKQISVDARTRFGSFCFASSQLATAKMDCEN
jgi:hypothetical protein